MECPVTGVTFSTLYLFLLTTFVYLAFVPSGTSAVPSYQTSTTYSSPYETVEELVEEEFGSLYERDIQEMCASTDISVATKVLCKLIERKSEGTGSAVVPVRPWRQRRVQKRESTSISAFQDFIDNLRHLAMKNENQMREYREYVVRGLITPNGEVIRLPPTNPRLAKLMQSVG